MKNLLAIILFLCLSLTLTACDSQSLVPLVHKEEITSKDISSTNDTDRLYYTIDKVTLSKSYQSINPSVEVIKTGLDVNLLLTLGIVESTGVSVEKIEKKDKDVFIYINNENTDSQGDIVVPQVLLSLSKLSLEEIEELNFQIINENYSPLKANMDIGEAISKIESSLNISPSTFPTVSIDKKKDSLILNLDFINTIDLSDKKNPVINLDVSIDITRGEIVKFNKEPASTFIDEGKILEYIYNKYIFYKKEDSLLTSDDNTLWVYDIKTAGKEKIHTTKNNIKNLSFNEDENSLFIIESLEDHNDLYILELDDLKAYRVKLDRDINPCLGLWKDKDNLILVDKNNDKSDIYKLNISSNNLDYIAHLDKEIGMIDNLEDIFLFTLEDDKTNEIFITRDFKEITLVDQGSQAIFLNSDKIAYVKKNLLENTSNLSIYTLADDSIDSYSEIDIEGFFKWNNTLGIIEKNNIGSDNPLYVYDLKSEELNLLTSVKSNKVFLNSLDDILYINSSIDFKEEKIQIITFVDLHP